MEGKDSVREYLSKLGHDRMYPLVLRELADVIERPLSIIIDQPWQLGGMSSDCRKVNVTPIIKKSKKKHPVKYRLVTLPSIPEKVMEQLILETISRHMTDRKIIRSSQHGLTKGKSG